MIARLVASVGGVGHFPWAPGTAGSAVAIVLGAGLLSWQPAALAVAAVLAAGGGWLAVRQAGVAGDPGWVVIDEVAGQMVAMLPLRAPSWLGLLTAFALFRLLDITKPGPIGRADRQPGATGVMADDLLAGAMAAGVLWLATTMGFPA